MITQPGVFGLGFRMQNSAEAIQIESGDVVIALPFKVDAQSTCVSFVMYAHCEGCIPGASHRYRFFRLFQESSSR